MPKKAKEVSALHVKRLKRPGLHAVGGVAGLHLQITPTGARSWILRATVGARRRDVGLGAYPDVTLGAARDRAREARDQIRRGIDPIEERQVARARLVSSQASAISFDEASRRFLAVKTQEFRNAKHAAQWASTLATYASPKIGRVPVRDVDLHSIVAILEPIWTTKTETASRLRGRIEAVLAWARVNGYRTGDNPARWKGHLDAVLPKPSKVSKIVHHKALSIDETPAFVRNLREREWLAARALEFAILTAARSGEVRGATWPEFDLDARIWTVPEHRMKSEKEHRVPLSNDAIELLHTLPHFEGNELVFPAPRGGKMSDAALLAVMRRMKVDATPHGFRSTFRDWCEERTEHPHAAAEMALGHAIGDKVEAAYRRGDLFDKRRKMMAEWARFCRGTK